MRIAKLLPYSRILGAYAAWISRETISGIWSKRLQSRQSWQRPNRNPCLNRPLFPFWLKRSIKALWLLLRSIAVNLIYHFFFSSLIAAVRLVWLLPLPQRVFVSCGLWLYCSSSKIEPRWLARLGTTWRRVAASAGRQWRQRCLLKMLIACRILLTLRHKSLPKRRENLAPKAVEAIVYQPVWWPSGLLGWLLKTLGLKIKKSIWLAWERGPGRRGWKRGGATNIVMVSIWCCQYGHHFVLNFLLFLKGTDEIDRSGWFYW